MYAYKKAYFDIFIHLKYLVIVLHAEKIEYARYRM